MKVLNGYALLAGIANYKYAPPLPKTVLNDVRGVAAVLRDPALCAYPDDPDHVRLLENDRATRDGFLDGLRWIKEKADEDASVFIYFSGHGGRTEGVQAGEYLIPWEGTLSETRPWDSNISGNQFVDALKVIKSVKLLVVLDCCRSAGIAHAKGSGPAPHADAPRLKPGLTDGFLDKLATGRGRVIFSASRSHEDSYIAPNAANSLFTEHLLGGLRGGAPSEDGLIGVIDLFEYVSPRVTVTCPDQHPQMKAEYYEGRFPVAMYRGGTKGVIPKDAQGFRYDVYVSYLDRDPDATYVWDELVPRLTGAGLRVAVGGEVVRPGVARVVGMQRALQQSKRVLLVLSNAYLSSPRAEFENVLSQELGIDDGTYRVLPLDIEAIEPDAKPPRLRMLAALELTDARRAPRVYERLIEELRLPAPLMEARQRNSGDAPESHH
jgi:hypothetical protein